METKQRTEPRATQQQAAPLVPPVDIIETADGITVRADLPGVSKENLSIDVDGDTLTLEATVNLGEAANVQPLYAEVRVAQFRRSFVLGSDLDTDKVNAGIRNGVLTIQLPKREQARPRKISVRAE
ncbi:MAG TPA: Hsp20/alpha crystallin family protein [Usitatibacter sp.]|nr:Hsp20/alpha crystallin family protein [Usitatibacter sp.]